MSTPDQRAAATSGGTTRRASGLRHAVRALGHREYRLFFTGQSISLIGTWMQQVAMGWLVYRLTGSTFALGLVTFATNFPSFFLAPIGGVLADRVNRLRMVTVVQCVFMVQSLLLAALVLSGTVRVWQVFALAALHGLATGFDIPARQSLIVELVRGPADLANAIALNSSMFNAARLVGPSIAGVLIAATGEGPAFLINGLSYIAVVSALLVIRTTGERPASRRLPFFQTIREGFAYALGFHPFRSILTLLALSSFLAMPYTSLLPVFAAEILGGGPRTLGFLVSSAGCGALCGAAFLAARTHVRGLSRVIVTCATMAGAGLVAFSLSRHLLLSMAMLFVVGFGLMVQTASSNTMLQTIVRDNMRGRVMSLYTMALIGVAPIGALIQGSLARSIGTTTTVALGGVGTVLAGIWFARQIPRLRSLVRPIYVELGIIPEVATAMQTTTELRPK